MDGRDTDTTQTRAKQTAPGRREYFLAAVIAGLALVGAVAWGWMAATSLIGEIRDAARTAAPGEVTVNIEEHGTHHILHEQRTWILNLSARPDVTIDVVGPEGGQVTLDDPTVRQHLRLPGYVAETVASFEVTTPGEHRVVVSGELDGDETIAIVQDPVGSALRVFIGPVGLFALGLVVGVIIALRAFAARQG